MKKNTKIRGKSIARRLNAALTRRSFAKTVLIDLIAALMVLFTWCFTVESANGGLMNVSDRKLTVSRDFNIIYNTVDFADGLRNYIWEIANGFRPEFDITLPFDGIGYSFCVKRNVYDEPPVVESVYPEITEAETEMIRVEIPQAEEVYPTEGIPQTDETEVLAESTVSDDGDVSYLEEAPAVVHGTDDVYEETILIPEGVIYDRVISGDGVTIEYVRGSITVPVTVDASGILTIVTCGFIVLFLIQAVSAIFRGFLGGGLIKQYLRPIDDIAMMAEQLSSESYVYSEPVKKVPANEKSASESVEQNEPVLDIKDVENLTDAIDGIADSRARINVQAAELSGLEAAINNMLKRLEESRRGQIRFVDDASHELRTPIAVIQGYANMLDRWGKDDPEVREEAITAIKNESEHIKTLLDQLLFLARGEMDRHVFEKVPISADLLAAEVVEESKMLDKSHIYEVIVPASAEGANGITVTADYAMLKQCVRILCDNAVKYTPEGGTITLKTEERVSADEKGRVKREVCIEVADTGIGITAEELPRIFDRFYRGENARSDNTGGSGLGLSIARWIAEQHRGRIEAISSPGFGTKMTVIIPCGDADE